MGEKELFLRIYANLPIAVRNEIILVLDGIGPITWEVAFVEVSNDTELSGTILAKLSGLGII